MLLTGPPIGSIEQVREVIQFYCVRWMIEVFFRTLKSGCRVEGRLFEQTDRLLPCLAVYLIVTWRTLYVCRLGREFPEISCEAVFEPSEWKSVYRIVRGETPRVWPDFMAVLTHGLVRGSNRLTIDGFVRGSPGPSWPVRCQGSSGDLCL